MSKRAMARARRQKSWSKSTRQISQLSQIFIASGLAGRVRLCPAPPPECHIPFVIFSSACRFTNVESTLFKFFCHGVLHARSRGMLCNAVYNDDVVWSEDLLFAGRCVVPSEQRCLCHGPRIRCSGIGGRDALFGCVPSRNSR